MVINYKFLFPLIAFLGTVAITTLRPVLVLYVRNFGFSAFLIGFIPAVYMLLRGVFSFFSGSISDRIGKRKIFLYIGTGLSILGTILLFSIETFKLYFTGTHIYLLVLFCRFLQGLSAGILWPIAQVMVLESSPDNKKAFYMALYFNSGVLGFIISDFLIAILGKLNASLNAFLYISVLLLFFQLIFVKFVKETYNLNENPENKNFKYSFKFFKKFVWFYILIFLVGGFQGINTAFVVLFLNEHLKFGLGGIGVVFFLKDFLRIFVNQFVSYIGDKKGILKISVLIGFLSGISSIFLSFSHKSIFFVILFVITYSFVPSLFSLIRAYLSHKVKKQELGGAIGILNTASNFSTVIFSFISGLWYDLVLWKTGIFFVTGLTLILVILLIRNKA